MANGGRKQVAQMNFPLSEHVQARRLVLRNNTPHMFVVKLVPSSTSLISFSPLSQNKRSIYSVDAETSVSIKVILDQSQVSKDELEQLMKQLRLSVYCTKMVCSSGIRNWLFVNAHSESELVQKFNVVRTKDFSALKTILDLPGQAHLIKAVLRPSLDVDDSDCQTAHRVDSDTQTVIPLTEEEQMDTLPSALLQTCRQWNAYPFFSNGFCNWMTQAISTVFPAPCIAPTFTDQAIREIPTSTPPNVNSKEDANVKQQQQMPLKTAMSINA